VGRAIAAQLPLLGSNQDSSDPESDVLPVTPRGKNGTTAELHNGTTAELHNGTTDPVGSERATGLEPATLSLGS
jgi:hypothetical protein